MNLIGDLAIGLGFVGLITYLCFLLIRFSSRSGRLKTTIDQYEEVSIRLRAQNAELEQQCAATSPELDDLVSRAIDVRSRRDRLSRTLEEMQERVEERDREIGRARL